MKKARGFTMIELMIAVAVVGILGAIAFPNYSDHVRKGRRSDAQTALMELAQKQEVFYARNASYTVDMTDLAYANASWNDVKGGSNTDYYQVQTEAADATSYTLLARPKTGTGQEYDKVLNFRLVSTGARDHQTAAGWIDGWDAR